MATTLPQDRVEPGSYNLPLASFPSSCSTTPANPDGIASGLIDQLNHALSTKNYDAVSSLFLDTGYWRDHLCLSWDFRTLKGSDDIKSLLGKGCRLTRVEVDRSSAIRAPHAGPIDAFGEIMGVEFFVAVTTEVGRGRGIARLAEVDGRWKISTLFTSLEELSGHEEAVKHRRPVGVQHGEQRDRENWLERRNADVNFEGKNPAVVIIGAGQSGLTAAARLKMLNVDTLIIDNEDRIGDSWRRRYHHLVLHDPVWFDQMPYLQFPPNWPVFTPKDKMGDFFESYVKLLELNVWTKTDLKSSSWDEGKKEWTIVLERRKGDGTAETRTLYPRHVIQATGHSGKKHYPTFKGMESFQGDRMCHSADFSGANPASSGKKAAVVGSCNSGHDIAQDYYEKGYDVTMVQRSSTCVITSESITELALKPLFSEDAPPLEDADLLLWGLPSELFKTQQTKVTAAQNKNDAKILDGLAKAGFKANKGPSDAGLLFTYLQRGGGYYIDVGGSQLIADGKIKVKQGQEITEVLANGLKFADGSELPADEIIFATGYENMRSQARIMFGDELADRVGDVWGFDREGETRTVWRRSGQPGFWFMGGNLALCRYYSRLLALQIKALEVGITSYGEV